MKMDLVRRLRAGDEDAFTVLVERHHASMVRLARGYVRSDAVAEEVAQEAWLGLLRGPRRFEGRSSLRTWLLRIVVNRAISTGIRERVHLPVRDDELEDDRAASARTDGGWPHRRTGRTRRWTAWWPRNWRRASRNSSTSCRKRSRQW